MRKYILSVFLITVAALFLMGSDCDHGLEPRFTAVEGDVIFEGGWPEGAEMAFVVVVDEKPDELVLDINLLKGFYQIPDDQVGHADSLHFSIDVGAGVYNWAFVAILDSVALNDPDNGLGWRNLAGEYRDPADSTALGSILVGEDERPHIRIGVDFDTPYVGVGNDPGNGEYFHLEG